MEPTSDGRSKSEKASASSTALDRLSIGFTGTRHGMTTAQRAAVLNVVLVIACRLRDNADPWVAHHGDCIGADTDFHVMLRRHTAARIVLHPGPKTRFSAGCSGDERRDPLPFLLRNFHIVRASTTMIAAPAHETEQGRGGTWATVKLARAAERPLAIVFPSGALLKERWP